MRNDSATLQQFLGSAAVKNRLEKILESSPESFISSILTIYRNNSKLQDCSPNSILNAAVMAAILKLPITPSLGFAYIVPYKGQATFQIGWKGLVQLAMRSNLYRTINAGKIYEGQIKEIDFITGEIIRGEKISDEVVGYIAYIELLNGFQKSLYMSVGELEEHAKKYSQSYSYDLHSGKNSSVWSKNFDAMAKKTVLKLLLSRFGIFSIDQRSLDLTVALRADQAVVTENGFRYIDNEQGEEKIVPFDDILDGEKIISSPESDGEKDEQEENND